MSAENQEKLDQLSRVRREVQQSTHRLTLAAKQLEMGSDKTKAILADLIVVMNKVDVVLTLEIIAIPGEGEIPF